MIHTDGKPTIANRIDRADRRRNELSTSQRTERIEAARVIAAAERITKEAAQDV